MKFVLKFRDSLKWKFVYSRFLPWRHSRTSPHLCLGGKKQIFAENSSKFSSQNFFEFSFHLRFLFFPAAVCILSSQKSKNRMANHWKWGKKELFFCFSLARALFFSLFPFVYTQKPKKNEAKLLDRSQRREVFLSTAKWLTLAPLCVYISGRHVYFIIRFSRSRVTLFSAAAR